MVEKDAPKNVFKIGDGTYMFVSSRLGMTDTSSPAHTTVYEYELSNAGMKPEVSKWFSLNLTVTLTESEMYSSVRPAEFGLTAYFNGHDILINKMGFLVADAMDALNLQYHNKDNSYSTNQGPRPAGGFCISINGLKADNLLVIEKAFREKMVEVAQRLDRMEQPLMPVVELIRHAKGMAVSGE